MRKLLQRYLWNLSRQRRRSINRTIVPSVACTETLEARLLLSANVLIDLPNGGDHTVVISDGVADDGMINVTIDGITNSHAVPTDPTGQIVIDDGTGNDSFLFHSMDSAFVGALLLNSDSGGNDIARLFDTSADDTVEALLQSTNVTLDTGTFAVTTSGEFTEVHVYSVNGGTDTADLYGVTNGSDTFIGNAVHNRITDGTYTYFVHSFSAINVDGLDEPGGDAGTYPDTARIWDSSGDDSYMVSEYWDANTHGVFKLTGTGFTITGKNFETTLAYATNDGNDIATLIDSKGDDLYTGQNGRARLAGAGFAHEVFSFDSMSGYSVNGGDDSAYLFDSTYDDVLVGDGNSLSMRNASLNQTNTAYGFAVASAFANNGGFDKSFLYDSAGNDTYVANPTFVRMEATDYNYKAYNFEAAYGFSENGGTDIAYMHDSPGNDTYTANPFYVRMIGPSITETTHVFENYAYGFEYTTGFALNGGNDTARLVDSDGDDFLLMNEARIVLEGENSNGDFYQNTARGFETNTASAVAGGADEATFYDTAADDDFIFSPTTARLNSSGVTRQARFFETVIAYAVNGGNDNAFLYGSTGSDRFVSTRNRSTFSSGTFYVTAQGFEQTIGYGNGGDDTAEFEATVNGDFSLGENDWYRVSRTNGLVSRVNGFDTKADIVTQTNIAGNDPVILIGQLEGYNKVQYTFQKETS